MGKTPPFWKFWLNAFKTTLHSVLGIIGTTMFFIAIILSIISFQHPEWENWLNIIVWALPLALFLMLFVPVVMVKSYLLYKQKTDQADEYEAVSLDIFYDDKDEACKCDPPFAKGWQRIWRVRVKNSQGLILEKVKVWLQEATPQIPDLKAALHPMCVQESKFGRWEGDGSFSIHPGATEYVDVLRYVYYEIDGGRDELRIVLQLSQCMGRRIDYGSYEFTIKAQGERGKPVIQRFGFEASDDRQMHFCAL